MNNKLPRKIFGASVIAFIFFIVSSCSIFHHHKTTPAVVINADTTRLIVEKIDSSQFILSKMKEKLFRFETFSGKAKINVNNDAGNNEYTATIRMKKDSAIWLSLGEMGIEGVRVFITPDSVRINDKIDKKYFSYDFSFFEKLTGLKLDFQTLQDLISGRPVYFSEKKLSAERKDSTFILKSNDESVSNTITLNRDYQMRSMQMYDSQHARDLLIDYFQYDKTVDSLFSMERLINITQPKAMEIKFSFTKIKLNEVVRFPFNRKGD